MHETHKGGMSMTLRLVVAFLILSTTTVLSPTFVKPSSTKSITATHTYVMGDNDSKNDARRICFLEAKRKVLEKAGTFIEASSEIKNFQLSRDQITSYTAAVLSVETTTEDFSSSNGQNTITMTVKADVDTADVQRRLAAIVADKALQEKIAVQQQQIRTLEEQMRSLNVKLGDTSANAASELRKERNVIFGDIHRLESKKLAAIKAITGKTDTIRNYIVRNMTQEEVRSILGTYRDKDSIGDDYLSWNYGELWVCFTGRLVTGVGPKKWCDPNELK